MDKSLEKRLESVDDLAKQCKVKLNVQNSFVKHPNPSAIHYDAKADNLNAMHYIGQALSFIVHDDKTDKLLCNEICLASKLKTNLSLSLSYSLSIQLNIN